MKGRNTIMSHLEWVGNEFLEKPPESQPKVKANMCIMTEVMKKFRSNLSKFEERKLKNDLDIAGLTNTGAQTNSSGPALLEKLNSLVRRC